MSSLHQSEHSPPDPSFSVPVFAISSLSLPLSPSHSLSLPLSLPVSLIARFPGPSLFPAELVSAPEFEALGRADGLSQITLLPLFWAQLGLCL